MKALIISVGTGTKPTKQAAKSLADAIAYTIKHHNPDKTFFITTKESKETTLPLILAKTKNQSHKTIKIQNPDNIQEIYETLHPHLQKIKQKFNQLVIDYTSGTKAMTAALAILATIHEANELSYITGKRKGGIVQPGTEQIVSIRPYFATTQQKLKTATEFFNKNQFSATITILTQIQKTTKDPEILNQIKPLLNLAKAYELWDKFQHEKAWKILKKIKNEKLNQNKKFLAQLINKKQKNQEPEPYIIADLINNAERRAREETKYDDATARLYRTIELIAQHTLKNKYQIDTSNIPPTTIPKNLIKKWNIQPNTKTIKTSLQQNYELLKAKNHPLGEKFLQDKKLQDLLKKRNISILAHGQTPVTKQTYNQLNKKVKEYARTTIKNLEELIQNSKFIKWK
jgi:CRISPR-associated protein (TIGR02710 family)